MKRIDVRIEGTTPLLCNRFTDEAAIRATNQVGASGNGDKGTPREQAEPKLYLDANGLPGIPQPNVFRCIIDAGKYFKNGKSKVTTLKSSIIPSCVSIDSPVVIPIQTPENWEVDTRPIVNPATGGRRLAYRPCFNVWALEFCIEIDTDDMSPKFLREIIDAAGKKVGLGDFRPDRKGPFGKFVVTKWQEN